MNPNEQQNFSEMLSGVYDFYGRDLSDFAVSLWWRALKNFDYKAVQVAFDRHLMNPDTGQFLPKPADIVRMLAGKTVDSAQVAWSKVDKAVRTIGVYESIIFDDPLIHRVIFEMGGWCMLGDKKESEWPFVANEFRTRYQSHKSRSEIPEYPPKLIGVYESQNLRNGFSCEDVIIFGSKENASIVFENGATRALTTITRAPLLALQNAELQEIQNKEKSSA